MAATNIYLTDEDSEVAGYKRARIGARSDCPSLVRAATATAAGPTSGVQATRTAGGTALAWLTDPLDGTDLTAAAWTVHAWASESDAAANAALRVQVLRYAAAEGATVVDDNPGTELGTAAADVARATAVASVTAMNDGDRLAIKLILDDATAQSMAAGYTCTLSYNGQVPRAEGDTYLTCPDGIAETAQVPAATLAAVRNLIRDTSGSNPTLSDAQLRQAVDEALRIYSGDHPLERVAFLSGDGVSFAFPLPAGFIWGWSILTEVEYPTGEQLRVVIDPTDWEVLEGRLGPQPVRYLRFPELVPDIGTLNMAVRFTTRHSHTDELDTVPPDHLAAVEWLAGSFAAQQLAAKAAQQGEPTLQADVANYRDGVQRWKDVAKALRDRYDAYFGGGDAKEAVAAGRTADWDTVGSLGFDRFWHRRRWR